MADRTAKLLSDIVRAADAIPLFVAQLTFETYCDNLLVRSAVERQFEIIGEALRRLQSSDPVRFACIPEAARIISFRNLIAHGYDAVDDAIVWQAIKDKLPDLRLQVEEMLAQIDRLG